MAKLSELPLNELYERPKITAAVEAAIRMKEDFHQISEQWCNKVCKLKCKDPSSVVLYKPAQRCDILLIQDFEALNERFDESKGPGYREKVHFQILQHLCREAGMSGLTFKLVNLSKCPADKGNLTKGKPPTAVTLMKCSPYLHQEIINSRPKVIVSLSTVVTKALGLKHCSNTGNRGEIHPISIGDMEIPVVITLHPRVLLMIRQNASGAFWSSDYKQIVANDLKKANSIARGNLTVPPLLESVEAVVRDRIRFARSIDNVKDIAALLASLPANTPVSLDTETTGLDGLAPGAKLLTIQFGWRDQSDGIIKAAVVPLWHRENSYFDPDEAWRVLTPFLIGPQPKVAHNGKFDVVYVYHTTGVRVRNLKFDTMLLRHALDSGASGCFGLKVSVWDYLPESGLGGYEDLLPKLGSVKKEEEDSEDAPYLCLG